MFIDEIKVFARAGHGGRGCVAFQREKFKPKGGPSGGNGGRGGDVILQADRDLNNLIAQYYQPRLLAENGRHGLGKGMDGRAGQDLVVRVPCGTLVWRLTAAARVAESEETTEAVPRRAVLPVSAEQRPLIPHAGSTVASSAPAAIPGARSSVLTWRARSGAPLELLADLTEHGQRFVLCRGGRGGLGNRNFATARRQAPRFAQPGEPGEEGEFLLELRLMAEVGLVGFPNAGKSTLLSAISHARPKIAPYPFTTLHPQIGIVDYPDDYHRLTVCDVPGLIAGAHRNVGLGHAFLRHIQRCKVLVLLLDMAGTDGRQPWDDFQQLLDELGLYDPGLLEKPRIVVANKMDDPVAEANLKKFKRRVRRTPVLPISAAFGLGLDKLRRRLREAVAGADDAPPSGSEGA
jgi:GTP-binding protein